MSIVLGATHDLSKKIRTHLFVISPNNSGSTFVKNALATSRHTWNLQREGQHTLGFSGPQATHLGVPLIWAAEQEPIAYLTRPDAYDWEHTRRAWYFQAFSHDAGASVFVEKSPPFLLIVPLLIEHFTRSCFLFMVRDPYAVVEGILRRFPNKWDRVLPGADPTTTAARHVCRCLALQRQNLERFGHRGVFFTYEEMCEVPERVETRIRTLVPALDDFVVRQRVPVKRHYDEVLRNMNDDQIGRLSPVQVACVNDVFASHRDVLLSFGYALRDPAHPLHSAG